MQVANVIDRSFAIVRREWRAAVLIGAVMVLGIGSFLVVAVLTVLAVEGWGATGGPDVGPEVIGALVPFWVFLGVGGVVFALLSYLANGVAVRAGVHGPEEGTGWDDLVPHIGPAAWASLRILGWSLLAGVAAMAVFVPLMLVLARLGSAGADLAILAAILLVFTLFAAVIALAPILMVAIALVYADEQTVPAAVVEALGLVRGRYWQTVGAVVVLWLFSLVPVVGGLLLTILTPSYQAALLLALRNVPD